MNWLRDWLYDLDLHLLRGYDLFLAVAALRDDWVFRAYGVRWGDWSFQVVHRTARPDGWRCRYGRLHGADVGMCSCPEGVV